MEADLQKTPHLKYVLTIFCGLILSLSALAQPMVREPDTAHIRMNRIRSFSVYEHSYTAKKNRGEQVRKQYYKKFDRQGHLLQKYEFGPGRGPYRTDFNYNDMGALVTSLTYDPYEGGIYSTAYDYDKDGKNVARIHYDVYGRLEYKNVYKYDEEGKPLEQGVYDLAVKLSSKDVYTYDSSGMLSEAKLFYTDGKVAYTVRYFYDEDKRPVEVQRYDGKDSAFSCRWLYKYDRRGNVIRESFCDRSGEITEESTFKYDRKGDILEQVFYLPKDVPAYKYRYKYHFFRK